MTLWIWKRLWYIKVTIVINVSFKDTCYVWSKNSQISNHLLTNIWTVELKGVRPLVKRWSISWITGENFQKLLIFAVFASYIMYIARVLKTCNLLKYQKENEEKVEIYHKTKPNKDWQLMLYKNRAGLHKGWWQK